MSVPVTLDDFLDLVCRSGLVDPDRLEAEVDLDELPEDPSKCAAVLIKAGFLTSYQAKQLLAGKTRGFILGAYRIMEPIGQGGMGTVYLAQHTSLNRRAAVKVLATDKSKDKLTLERFYREARAVAALDHPNIVRLHDVSQGSGVHFIVMEYVEGNDLQSLMGKTGPLHYVQAVQYISQAAAGLQHAHQKGFVHRDIKPSNLIVNKEGVVKILDMGLARSFSDAKDNLTGRLGEKNEIAGTIDYLAPEQALGQIVDERADLYSLGVTLYSLITGNTPFTGTTAQKIMQHQMADPEKLTKKLNGKVPPALCEVIQKMLAKKPTDRYQTAEEVIDALGPWLPAPSTGNIVQNPVTVSDGTRGETVSKKINKTKTKTKVKKRKKAAAGPLDVLKENKWLAAGIAGGVGVLVMLVLALLPSSSSNDPLTSSANAQATNTETAPTTTQVLSSTPKPKNTVRKWTFSTVPSDVLLGLDEKPERLAISKDGTAVAVGGREGGIGVWNLATRKLELKWTETERNVVWLSFSPDGTRVATASHDGVISVWDRKTGKSLWSHKEPNRASMIAEFSPDGSRVVGNYESQSASGKICVFDADSGSILHNVMAGPTHSISFLKDGKTAVLGTFSDQKVTYLNIDTARITKTIGVPYPGCRAISVSPSGRWLAVAKCDRQPDSKIQINLHDALTGEEKRTLNTDSMRGTITFMSFSNDESLLATCGTGHKISLWEVDSGNIVQEFSHDPDITTYTSAAVFSKDDKWVISTGDSGTIHMWPTPEAPNQAAPASPTRSTPTVQRQPEKIAGKVVYKMPIDKLPEFYLKIKQRDTVLKRSPTGYLCPGIVFSSGTDPNFVAEYFQENQDGRMVIRFYKVSGGGATSIYSSKSMARLATNKKHILLLEYNGESRFQGKLLLRHEGQSAGAEYSWGLKTTNGEWVRKEFPLTPQQPNLFMDVVNESPAGPDNSISIRRFELIELD